MAWYSGVSGACCPSPGGLVSSQTTPTPRVRLHCPDQSGYFVSSNAAASERVITNTTINAIVPNELRCGLMTTSCMRCPYWPVTADCCRGVSGTKSYSPTPCRTRNVADVSPALVTRCGRPGGTE